MDWVVVSPDVGSVARTRKFAEILNLPIAIIDKRRPKANESQVMNIIGDVVDKNIIMIDDLIDTAGTIVHAAEALKENGAFSIYACCSHGVLSGPAPGRIKNSPIKELVVLNTINDICDMLPEKIKVLSVADKFAKAIGRIYENISMETI